MQAVVSWYYVSNNYKKQKSNQCRGRSFLYVLCLRLVSSQIQNTQTQSQLYVFGSSELGKKGEQLPLEPPGGSCWLHLSSLFCFSMLGGSNTWMSLFLLSEGRQMDGGCRGFGVLGRKMKIWSIPSSESTLAPSTYLVRTFSGYLSTKSIESWGSSGNAFCGFTQLFTLITCTLLLHLTHVSFCFQLLDTKSTDRKQTLLHYISNVVKEKYQQVTLFYNELHYVEKAAAGTFNFSCQCYLEMFNIVMRESVPDKTLQYPLQEAGSVWQPSWAGMCCNGATHSWAGERRPIGNFCRCLLSKDPGLRDMPYPLLAHHSFYSLAIG